MFQFKSVTKQYKSVSGKECTALLDINLILPDTGMVFLVGRSGSGKSTFLNILGGLDKPTAGEVVYDGVSFSSFQDDDYADYRNKAMGFIFQDYNLLEDNITVEQNIMIPLFMQSQKNSRDLIRAALKKVEMEGYEKQRINELSGGQKQRVAIARALIKNPKVILADEPTGNLDAETGEMIFGLLKKLAESALVVVVTHDLGNAKRYYDYLIELKNGKLIFNSCPGGENETKTAQEHPVFQVPFFSAPGFNTPAWAGGKKPKPKPSKPDKQAIADKVMKRMRSRLPVGIVAKMGAGNLGKKPIRTGSVVFTSLVTILCIVIFQLFVSYSSVRAEAEIIDRKEVSVFSLTGTSPIGAAVPFSLGVRHYLEEEYAGIKLLAKRNPDNGTVIEGSGELLDFGYTFVDGYTELDENSVYVTADLLEHMYDSSDYRVKLSDGTYKKLLKSEYPPAAMAGRVIRFSSVEYAVAGVVQTDGVLFGKTEEETRFYDINYGTTQFYLPSYVNRQINNTLTLNSSVSTTVRNEDGTILLPEGWEAQQADAGTAGPYRCVLFSDGTIAADATPLNLNASEIVVSLDLYNRIFASDLTRFDYVDYQAPDGYSRRRTPEHLGETVEFKVEAAAEGAAALEDTYTVVGVSLDFGPSSAIDSHILFAETDYFNLNDCTNLAELMVNRASVADLDGFLRDMDNRGYQIRTQYSEMLRQVERSFTTLTVIFFVTGIVLGIVMILLVVNTISFGITNRTKELGILKALGVKNRDLFSIFLSEAFILSAGIFVLSIALAYLGVFVAARLVADVSLSGITIFAVNGWTYLTIFVASFAFIFLATLIPLLRIKKMNPVDAIKRTAR